MYKLNYPYPVSMDQKDSAAIKARIAEEIAKTQEAIAEYKEMSQPIAPENAIGRVSRMDAINNKSVIEAALRKAEDRLRNLESMKSKAGDPNFGRCKGCKQPIPLGRLLLMPESSYCVGCAR